MLRQIQASASAARAYTIRQHPLTKPDRDDLMSSIDRDCREPIHLESFILFITMPRSRLTSLLLATFLGFHLQMGVADLACASGVMAGSTDAMAGMDMQAADTPADGTPEDGANDGDAPCNGPGAPAGCKLMAPCVTGMFESAQGHFAEAAAPTAAPPRMIVLAPMYRSPAPEPPPPRA